MLARGRNEALLVAVLAMLAATVAPTSGAKLMMAWTSIINTASQHIVASAMTEPLVEQGHQVVLVLPQNKILKGLSPEAVTDKIYFASSRSKENLQEIIKSITQIQLRLSESTPYGVFQLFKENVYLITEGCTSLFKDKETLEALKKEKFDLMISMTLVGCDPLLAEYLGIPFVVMSPVRRSLVITEDHLGIPIPSSYVPFSLFTTFTDRMSFKERVLNNFFRHVLHPLIEYVTTLPVQAIKSELNIRPDLTLSQLMGEAQLWFAYSNFALEFAQPTAPNWIPIGGITAKPAKELPKDLNDFVEGSGEHGIIVFTLGSTVTSLDNVELTENIAQVFSELPQRVLWRYKGTRPRNLGNNTRIADWLPQNDLLGHPKTRMLIYHGGAAGVYEATSHGVPLLLMPLAADQMGNAARVESKGLGFAVDKNTMTAEIFRNAVNEILSNPKYKTNMVRAAAIMRDQPVSPRDAVVFWVEHILKFGGDHLRLRALELNFIQRNSIDVIAFVIVVFFTFLFALRWFICKCCCCLCASKKVKAKSD